MADGDRVMCGSHFTLEIWVDPHCLGPAYDVKEGGENDRGLRW